MATLAWSLLHTKSYPFTKELTFHITSALFSSSIQYLLVIFHLISHFKLLLCYCSYSGPRILISQLYVLFHLPDFRLLFPSPLLHVLMQAPVKEYVTKLVQNLTEWTIKKHLAKPEFYD